ncbi:hypothetical protein, partial [Cronobacter sakazakii]|uniref:hypothetical protein n=1 Tax=Cronobacter sakazakii TaxID=28141 RepID=UPI001F165707
QRHACSFSVEKSSAATRVRKRVRAFGSLRRVARVRTEGIDNQRHACSFSVEKSSAATRVRKRVRAFGSLRRVAR